MKKRILLLIPCLLLALGLLTACGSNGGGQTSGSIENQLINATWEGKAKDASGLIKILFPLLGDDAELISIKFDSESNSKTGYISVLKQKISFTWNVQSKDNIVLTFDNDIHVPITLNFRLNGNSLSLTGNGINIKLNRT